MFAIFKRELRSYFTSLVGYVVIGVMLAFTGLYYSANCLVYGTSDFSTVLYSTTLVMLFLLPALTMRSFADERRNKTDQLLLTSPVGIPSIVMGKYFAQLAVFAVPMAAAAIMPLVLTAFGTISLTSAYATWLAYFLMGAACIAIGTFVSALTENQIIAYLATFGALLICYLMNGIKSLFTSGNTLAFIVFCVVLAVVALLVGLACKNVTVGSAVFCGGAVVLVLLGAKGCPAAGITLPGVGYVDLGIAAPLLWEGLLVALAECVRIADGMDGIVCGTSFAAMLGLMGVMTLLGWFPLGVLPAALAGSLMAFLLWNFPPAKLRLGSVGSLFLAGMLGCVPLCIGWPDLTLPLALPFWLQGGMVALQILVCKASRGRRQLFRSAPLHRWLELRGQSAEQIFYTFCVIAMLGVALTVQLAKIS